MEIKFLYEAVVHCSIESWHLMRKSFDLGGLNLLLVLLCFCWLPAVLPRNFTNLKHSPRQLPTQSVKDACWVFALSWVKQVEANPIERSHPSLFLHETCREHMVRWAKEHFRVGLATVRWTRYPSLWWWESRGFAIPQRKKTLKSSHFFMFSSFS